MQSRVNRSEDSTERKTQGEREMKKEKPEKNTERKP